MNLSVGIVGLPNVGKSTLFNALLKKQQALAANYPFATIEPNVGIVPVPDSRLEKLAEVERDSIASLQNDTFKRRRILLSQFSEPDSYLRIFLFFPQLKRARSLV